MRILVTGAGGFIGKPLVHTLLKSGIEIIAVDRHEDRLRNNDCEFVVGDISRDKILEKIRNPVDMIIHLSASVNGINDVDYTVDNVHGTYEVVKWAQKNLVSRIIYPSTVGVYDSFNTKHPVSEKHLIKPANLYTLTKYLGEEIVRCSKISHTILRFSYIYGPGDQNSSLANMILNIMRKKIVSIYDEGRDYLYIDDAINAFRSVISYHGAHSIFNIGSGERLSMKDISEKIGRICQTNIHIEMKEKRNGIYSDSSLAKRELRWHNQVGFDEGIQKTISFVKSLV